MPFRILNDVIRQPQLGRDRESVTLPGNPDQQTISGPQRFHAELTAGILHKRRGKGINLQLAVVSGGHRADAAAMQMIQHRNRQRRTLGGIRARPQFIEQTERITVRLLQD